MRKLIIFLVTGMLWCNVSLNASILSESEEIYEPLPIKDWKTHAEYNHWINDYNKFKENFPKEVVMYCRDQMIYSVFGQDVLDLTRCEYRAVVDLAKRFNINYNPISKMLHRWHEDNFAVAKSAAIAYVRCDTNRCKKRIYDQFWEKHIASSFKILKDLNREIPKKASYENTKYYAKKKKKKEEVPQIPDNEILPASSGTGFFVSKQGHLITNDHVVNGCDPVKIIHEGKDYEAEILVVDKMNDLAIIKANIIPKIVYSISNEDARMTETVYIAGFPLGKTISSAIKASKGTVTALAGIGNNYAEFQTDAALNSGNSGGPIINEKGNVVGVAVSKWQEEGVEGFNFGVKSSVLRIFANANELKFLPVKRKIMKLEEREALITGATVYLECWMTGKQIKALIAKKNSRKAIYSKYKK